MFTNSSQGRECPVCGIECDRGELLMCCDCCRSVCPDCRTALDRPDFPTSDVACNECKEEVLVRFERQISEEVDQSCRSPRLDAAIDRLLASKRDLFAAIEKL